MAEALIALGGNVGDVRDTLREALAMLGRGPGIKVNRRSPSYLTPAWGVKEQPPFINCCAVIETTLSPHDLLKRVQDVERAFGRDRANEQRWGPRKLDIDIIAYDDVIMNEAGLTLPHPGVFERAFVLVPLADIAADRVIAGVSVKDALAQVDATDIERLPPR